MTNVQLSLFAWCWNSSRSLFWSSDTSSWSSCVSVCVYMSVVIMLIMGKMLLWKGGLSKININCPDLFKCEDFKNVWISNTVNKTNYKSNTGTVEWSQAKTPQCLQIYNCSVIMQRTDESWLTLTCHLWNISSFLQSPFNSCSICPWSTGPVDSKSDEDWIQGKTGFY